MAEKRRWTKQSRTILDIIYESEEHLSASGVYDIARRSIPNISLGTVYRNLKKLESAGLIREATISGVSVFFKHPFSNAYYECDNCHRIVPVDIQIDIADMERRIGSLIKKWDLHLSGTCRDCAD